MMSSKGKVLLSVLLIFSLAAIKASLHHIAADELNQYIKDHKAMLENPYSYIEGIEQLAIVCKEGTVHKYPGLSQQLLSAFESGFHKLSKYGYQVDHSAYFLSACQWAVDCYDDQYSRDQLCYWNNMVVHKLLEEQRRNTKAMNVHELEQKASRDLRTASLGDSSDSHNAQSQASSSNDSHYIKPADSSDQQMRAVSKRKPARPRHQSSARKKTVRANAVQAPKKQAGSAARTTHRRLLALPAQPLVMRLTPAIASSANKSKNSQKGRSLDTVAASIEPAESTAPVIANQATLKAADSLQAGNAPALEGSAPQGEVKKRRASRKTSATTTDGAAVVKKPRAPRAPGAAAKPRRTRVVKS